MRAIADVLMPRVCAVCGVKLNLAERHICSKCGADLPLCRFEGIRNNPMAQAFNEMLSSSGQGLDAYQPYSYAAALMFYREDYRKIPHAVKYKRNFAVGRDFGCMLGQRMGESELWKGVDIVLPVPLHWARKWRRGYNQAEVIAKGIALGLDCPKLKTNILRRVRRTKTQTRLNKADRYANVSTAFVARANKIPSGVRHILLVDDVFTTGATLCACERALRAALSQRFGSAAASKIRISVATLAYVAH